MSLTIGTPKHGPPALDRPDAQHAGTIHQCRHNVALARLHAMLTDNHVTRENGHGSQGGVRYAQAEEAATGADGNGFAWDGLKGAPSGLSTADVIRQGLVRIISEVEAMGALTCHPLPPAGPDSLSDAPPRRRKRRDGLSIFDEPMPALGRGLMSAPR